MAAMDYIWRMLRAIFLLCCALLCGLLGYLFEQVILLYLMLFLILIGVGTGVINIIDYYKARKEE